MAIVKMSKIRVIGLLEDKDKVYNFLQNNQMVHIAPTFSYENTKSCDTAGQRELLTGKKEELDKLIEFITETLKMNSEPLSLTYEELIANDERIEKDIDRINEAISHCQEIKIQINELNRAISGNKDIIAKLLTNSEKNISELNAKKIISLEYHTDCKAKEMVEVIREKNSLIESELSQFNQKLAEYQDMFDDMKLLREKYEREIQKSDGDTLVRQTERTFIMEFYLPKEDEKDICGRLQKLSSTIVSERMEIKKGEPAPTLTRNNRVIRQAEFVTNMYSVPSYHEVDPNPLVFFFFMLFFGYIMADIGLGLAMVVIGYVVAGKIKEDNGTKKLWKVVGTGGIFAMFWGLLYNSLFGFSLPFLPTIMPDPSEKAILTLLFCLLMGVVHLAAGYFMKGLNALHERRVLDSFLDGFLWDTFFLGAVMALAKFMLEFFNIVDFTEDTALVKFLSAIQMPGVIILLVSLGITVILAGRHEKGFGKVIKPFTTLYGLINILSDILSYARLFGLMLSGAIISQQFDQIGLNLMNGSIFGYIMGGFVIVIGNAFNVAMGALSAYIHDCRLQYIEYFGKFYTGEGTLFTPFTPKYKYITIKQN